MPGRNLFSEDAAPPPPAGRNLFAEKPPVTTAQVVASDPSEYDPNSDAFKAKYAPPSWGQRILGNIRGAASLASSVPAGLAGGLTYLGTLGATGDTEAAKAVQEATQQKFHYTPDDPLAKDYVQDANQNLQWLGPKEGEIGGEKTTDALAPYVPAPVAAAAGAGINTLANAIPMLAGIRMGGVRGGSVREVVPELGDLKGASTAAYSAAKNSGELAPQTALHPLIKNVESYLTEKGFRPDNNPQTAQALKDLYDEATRPDADFTSMTGIDSLRKALRNSEETAYAKSQPGKTSPDAMMASDVVDKFDQWIDDNFPKAGGKWQEAKDLWRRYRNSETIQSLFDRAEVRGGQYSNAGPENALRVEFSRLATNPRRMRYFSDAEQAAIRDVATTNDTQLALRQIGKLFSPHSMGGVVLNSAMGGLFGLPAGLAAAAVGAASKAGAGRMRINAANRARDMVALGRQPGLANPPRRGAVAPAVVLPATAQEQ